MLTKSLLIIDDFWKKKKSNRGKYTALICCYAPQSLGMRNVFAISSKCYNSKDTNFVKRHNTLKSTFAKNRFASVIKHDTSAAKKFYFKLKLVTKMSYQQLVILFFQILKRCPKELYAKFFWKLLYYSGLRIRRQVLDRIFLIHL